MKVSVKTLRYATHEVEVDENATVHNVKEALAATLNIPIQGQKLVYKGQVLSDMTLKDAKYSENEPMVIMMSRPAPKLPEKVSAPAPTQAEIALCTSPLGARTLSRFSSDGSVGGGALSAGYGATQQQSGGLPWHDIVSALQGLAAAATANQGRQNPANAPPVGAQPTAEPMLHVTTTHTTSAAPTTVPEPDPLSLHQLTEMGFPANRARKALVLNRSNIQLAMEWLLEHMDDDTIDEDLTPEQVQAITQDEMSFQPDADTVSQLREMGFSDNEINSALRATNNNYEAACAWLLGDRDVTAMEMETEDDEDGYAHEGGYPDQLDEQSPIVQAILNSPTIQDGMANPNVIAAFQTMVDNPATVQQYVNDPDIGPVIRLIQQLLEPNSANGNAPTSS
eukprot:GFYU01000468.1.p1 GENE.GFYU01000468.1~~GFYU01000468.1.p1  ORF type:complete len:395 (+),score=87.07 GFYU01000468.1:32-1216(+)